MFHVFRECCALAVVPLVCSPPGGSDGVTAQEVNTASRLLFGILDLGLLGNSWTAFTGRIRLHAYTQGFIFWCASSMCALLGLHGYHQRHHMVGRLNRPAWSGRLCIYVCRVPSREQRCVIVPGSFASFFLQLHVSHALPSLLFLSVAITHTCTVCVVYTVQVQLTRGRMPSATTVPLCSAKRERAFFLKKRKLFFLLSSSHCDFLRIASFHD